MTLIDWVHNLFYIQVVNALLLIVGAVLLLLVCLLIGVIQDNMMRCNECGVSPRMDPWNMCKGCHDDWRQEMEMKRKHNG
jgi:hypothetical protein